MVDFDNSEWIVLEQDPILASKIRQYWELDRSQREEEIKKRTRGKSYFEDIYQLLVYANGTISSYNYDNETDTNVVERLLHNSLVPYCSFKLFNALMETIRDPVDIGVLVYFFSFKAPFVVGELQSRKINIHGFVSNIIATLSDFWGLEDYDKIEKLLRDHIINLLFTHKLNDTNFTSGMMSFSWLVDIFGVSDEVLFTSYYEQERMVKEKLTEMNCEDWSISLGLKYRLTHRQIHEAKEKLEELLALRAGRDTLPTIHLERDGFILRRIMPEDPRQLFLGYNNEYSCCYQIRGAAKTALFYSISDPGAGNYEIVTENYEPVLQFFIWTDNTDRNLCIDSLERGTHYNRDLEETYRSLLKEFGKEVVAEFDFDGVLAGSMGLSNLLDDCERAVFLHREHRPKTRELLGLPEGHIRNRLGLFDPVGVSIVPKAHFYADGLKPQVIIAASKTDNLVWVYTSEYHWSTAIQLAEMIRSGNDSPELLEEFIWHIRTAILLNDKSTIDRRVFFNDYVYVDGEYKDPYNILRHSPKPELDPSEEVIDEAIWHFIHIYMHEPVIGYRRVFGEEERPEGIDEILTNDELVLDHRRKLRDYYKTQDDFLLAIQKDRSVPKLEDPTVYVSTAEECKGEWVISDSQKEIEYETKKDLLEDENFFQLFCEGLEEKIDRIINKGKDLWMAVAEPEAPKSYTVDEMRNLMNNNIPASHSAVFNFSNYIRGLDQKNEDQKAILDTIFELGLEDVPIKSEIILNMVQKDLEWGIEHPEKMIKALNEQWERRLPDYPHTMIGYDFSAYLLLRAYADYFGIHPMTDEWFEKLPEDFAIAIARIQVFHSFPRKLQAGSVSPEKTKEIIRNTHRIFAVNTVDLLSNELDYLSSLMYNSIFRKDYKDGKMPSWENLEEFLALVFNCALDSLTDEFKDDIIRPLEGMDTDFWHNFIYDIRANLKGNDRTGLKGVKA